MRALRKVATLPQVFSFLPSLPTILPYLVRVCTDQTYMLKRSWELANTGAMSKFKWASGGEGWTDTYMDSRLQTRSATRIAMGEREGVTASITSLGFISTSMGGRSRRRTKTP